MIAWRRFRRDRGFCWNTAPPLLSTGTPGQEFVDPARVVAGRLQSSIPLIQFSYLRAIAKGEEITQHVSALENPPILEQLKQTT